ncbi:hypothetical protein CL617_03335 [archaeon]|nr:hypothetical protein [archaeon]|tara:strand:- start:1229 stop:1912 length:684 start_codon:yes stop_codon:yes gene_type:complete
MEKYDLSVTIPFFNEEKTVKPLVEILVKEFSKTKINYEILLVNNGSKDGTENEIKKLVNDRIKLVTVENNQGYGFGILNGFKASKGKYLGYIDGDLENLPSDVIKVYNKVISNNVHIGKGLRDVRSANFIRNIASISYDLCFSLLYFKFIKQLNAKPKIISKDFYDKTNLESKDWFIDTEILLKALKNNHKIIVENTSYDIKPQYKSNVRVSSVWEFFMNLVRFRFK